MTQTVITRRDGDYYGDGTHNHIWEITDMDGIVADLYVSADRHEIMNIEVRSDRRGEGLARALYEAACREMNVFHALAAHRTAEGALFANAVGGPTIEAYECGCAACSPIEDEDDEEF